MIGHKKDHADASPPVQEEQRPDGGLLHSSPAPTDNIPRDGDPCPRCNGTGVTQTMGGPGLCLYRHCANGTYQSDPAAA